jgi:hypothetical protein
VEFLLDGAMLGSDSSAPYSLDWNTATASSAAHSLQARAFDLVDNVGTSTSITVNVVGGGSGGTPLIAEFSNEDANDGYVKANADGSAPAVGTLEAYSGLAIGRGTDGKYNRALLSFDTSSLPDGATVVSATVNVTYRSAYGDPWSNPAGNTLTIDVHFGCRGACIIETGDYAGTMTAEGVAQLLPFTGGSQTSNLFSTAGLAAVNRAGRTQLRLRFSAHPSATNYLWIDKGASAKLRVEYLP